ncbi:hypothetical protein A2U01_0118143, partial [Trifolium medium]|nr:hypothetical protein [Trifolium medium]
PTVGEDDWLC